MKVIVDRFEENIAVVELDGEMLNAPRALFAGAREGDTVELTVLPRDSEPKIGSLEQAFTQVSASVLCAEKAIRSDAPAAEQAQDDSPAALFARLRSKKKKSDS